MILADKRKLKGNLISISRKSYPPPTATIAVEYDIMIQCTYRRF